MGTSTKILRKMTMKKTNVIKNIVLVLFTLFFVKLLSTGVSFEDSFIVAILSTLLGYLEFRSENEDLKEIRHQAVQLNHSLETTKKELEELRSHVSTVKLAQQVKTVSRL